MSTFDEPDSLNGTMDNEGNRRHNYGTINENEKQSVLNQPKEDAKDRFNSVADIAGSSLVDTETMFLVPLETLDLIRKWLFGPFCFLYMAAYITSYYTFSQYVYAKIQNEIFPDLISFNTSGVCTVNTSSPDFEKQMTVQEKAATWSLYYSLAAGIPAILSNVILGSSTDKFGRKFLFFLPCVGTFIRMGISTLGIYFNFDLKYHVIGFCLEGFTGQMFTVLIVCFTYVADLTPERGKGRSLFIAMIELSVGIAFTVFSFTTGYFIEAYSFFYPMLSAGVMVGLCFICALLIPETFPKEKRNSSGSETIKVKAVFELFFGASNKGRRWIYNTLMFAFAMTMFPWFGRSSVEPVYQLSEPFCWSPKKLGYFGSLRSLVQQFVGMALIKLLQTFMSDEAIAILGCLSYTASNALEGFASTDTTMYIVPVVGSVGLLTIPLCRSLLSKLTSPDKQGAIFAAIGGVETSINLVGSVAATAIYSETVRVYRGIVFFVFAGFNFLACLTMCAYRIGIKRTQELL